MSEVPETETAVHLTPGVLLNGRYAVERELGRGGVGVVYLARDRQLLDRPVVIKILLENTYRDEWIKSKFRQEMEALSRIDHPGIVGLLDTGELSDGRLFLVLQFIEGVSLRTLMRPEGMELERVANIMQQASAALDAAHVRGVLHRDLKPENIMVQSDSSGEQVRLIDFGLAKVLHSRVAESTAVPNVAGSYGYMSPEQLMARPVTPAGDVFSLAVIAYEMITGRRPHNPDSMFQLLEMLRAGVRVMPVDLRPSLPTAAQQVLLKALSFEPEQRYARAVTFGEDLASALLTQSPVPVTEAIPTTLEKRGYASGLMTWITIAILGVSAIFYARASFFRFETWPDMLSHPAVFALLTLWCLALLIPVLPLRSGGHRRVPYRLGVARLLLSWMACGFLLYGAIYVPPVVRAEMLPGTPASLPGYTLNYSDPRGFRYTVQEGTYFRVEVFPGRFNRISDYELKITLAPEVEFFDIYFDRGFAVAGQLELQPSATNDTILVKRAGDNFREMRSVLFTCKSRTPPDRVRFQVQLKTPGRTIEYEL